LGKIDNLKISAKRLRTLSQFFVIHSNSKFRVFIRKYSGRQLLWKFRVQKFYPKLRVFVPKLRVFEPKLRVFRTEFSGFPTETSCFWKPKFRVFKPKLFVLQRFFFCPTETSGVDAGIFSDRNFGISNPYEVSNEVLVERKPEKFSKFQAQWITVNVKRWKKFLPEKCIYLREQMS
jgi:hypothetical protein